MSKIMAGVKQMRFLILAVLAVGLLGPVFATTAWGQAPDALFGAHLTGSGGGTDSQGQGQANIKLSGDQLGFVLTLSKLDGEPTATHIHIAAAPGGNGPPVISLCGSFGPPPIPVASCNGPGAVKGSTSLSVGQIADLIAAVSEGRSYVNVHSIAFPPGEVRGQLSNRR